MKAKEIRELIDFISGSGLEEVNIETEEFKISVKRSPDQQVVAAAPAATPAPVAAPLPAAAPAATPAAEAAPAASDDGNYETITAPMIGTFYRASKPGAAPFISVGDSISVGTKLCILEAMKTMNEIESEVSGTIVKVLVDDASPVDFGKPLFLVDPS
ncbi:MAG: acetyl-CoA carboxylase biotin carboxyl carrier protein [Cytophagales bacterium]|nr:acetyl-CoA carboxylase biotin carboxyl carrier protein [Cytophagales bacterium]